MDTICKKKKKKATKCIDTCVLHLQNDDMWGNVIRLSMRDLWLQSLEKITADFTYSANGFKTDLLTENKNPQVDMKME